MAGCVDAIGYLRRRHFFVSCMSGDPTQLAVAAVRGDWGHARTPAAIVALFLAGVVAGRALSSAFDARGRPLVLARLSGLWTFGLLLPAMAAAAAAGIAITIRT